MQVLIRHLVVVAVILFSYIGLSLSPVAAETPRRRPGHGDSNDSLARFHVLCLTAKEAQESGRPADALVLYRQAFRLEPTPHLRWDLAQTYLLLGLPDKVQEELDRYVQAVQEQDMPIGRKHADVERLRDQARAQSAWLTLKADDPRARIYVDDVEINALGPVKVAAGEHRVEVRATQETVRQIKLSAGQRLALDLRAWPPPLPHSATQQRQRIARWVLGGTGLGGVVVGGLLGLLHGEQACPASGACLDRYNTLAGSIALISTGGLAIGGALILFGIERAGRPLY